MRTTRLAAALLVAAALASASCGTVGPGNNITESFTDTLQPFIGDHKEFPFNVGKTGEYSVKINSLDPPKNVFLQVYFGTPSALGCQVIQSNSVAYRGVTALSGAIQKGLWCVGIADLGSLAGPETFVLEVSHP
jgi:predicted small secreted protein